jgi:hypothetical protein
VGRVAGVPKLGRRLQRMFGHGANFGRG